jgi:NTE family protein
MGMTEEARSPVRNIEPGREDPTDGTALCLSGGGFRAMLFHLGVVWRLNEAGWLPKLDRVSSVSGGSITAALLATRWSQLDFDDLGVAQRFEELVALPLDEFATRRVDTPAILSGLAMPGVSIGERVAAIYRKELYGDTTLQDLPESPRFLINATNLETGSLVLFSNTEISDILVGTVPHPDVPVSVAVAASSAFPPFLSPYVLDLSESPWRTDADNTYTDRGFRARMSLTDGGVYDNLGLETAWRRCRRIIACDAGGRLGVESDPHDDWGRHMVRVLKVVDGQVRSLRRAQIQDALERGDREGVYLNIRSLPKHFPAEVADPIRADPDVITELAETPTRLDETPSKVRHGLINWGYALCDVWLRGRLDPAAPKGDLPYPDAPLTR